MSGERLPAVHVAGLDAHVVVAGSSRLGVIVPDRAPGGRAVVTVDGAAGHAELEIGTVVAKEIHQVDNPAIASSGTLYATCSGRRGQEVPVSVVRVGTGGVQEPYLSGIVNATSMAFDARGTLHISSRFDGTVYRVMPDDTLEVVASELGVACGIAFGSDGTLFVGDRGGTIFRIGQTGRVVPFVTLPPSIVAYHLAIGPEDDLFVAAPTLDPCDRVYRISRLGEVKVVSTEFGRPQGLACDAEGQLWVTEAVAGGAGLYLVREGRPRELRMAASSLVGVAFDPRGGLVVASGDTVYRLNAPVRPWIPRA
ncbi:MAG: gluconolaconase [Acidobacteria bacterium]|nr:gluconolaconase [Acidobacteriota bacterium]